MYDSWPKCRSLNYIALSFFFVILTETSRQNLNMKFREEKEVIDGEGSSKLHMKLVKLPILLKP